MGILSADDLRFRYPKFFGTMAYPYMNGTLHTGHSFTVSKIEFGAGYARMKGKRVLYPQGYHCTGMPIKACADKLVREIEMFGQSFETYPTNEAPDEPSAPVQEITREDITKFSGKKSKAAAKNVQMKYQFQIMLAIGIPLQEIHKFADPQYWLHFFPALCQRDLTALGCRIDWRRSMVTTDANPYYDAFVRWQMNRLKELGKVKFGKRYTIYSPKDSQACMDHDRSEGEGVGVQQYTALRLKVTEWSDCAKARIGSKIPLDSSVYFVPATLRPETMYGQTCCFIGPKILYGIFQVRSNEYYFISERSARNMAFQGIFDSKWGQVSKLVDLQGSDVVGTCVDAPLSVHKNIRILPMDSVKASKGTGIVTCVPSDSPDDFVTSRELQKKAAYYDIKEEWVSREIISVIETPSYGKLTAKFLVESMKIQSPKDTKALAEAKDLAYKEGFFKGTMAIGDYKGESVVSAKPKIRDQLVEAGDAFEYAEPDGFVKSRSGDECVTAHLDQWYLAYGKTETGGDSAWQQMVLDYIDSSNLNTFSTEAKNAFEQALDWLSVWPCARSYGLGSKIPWDHNFLVESLSDSTIYMSYYTISHLLHKDIFGQQVGPANIKAEQMTDEVWDYVFARTNKLESPCDIPQLTLDTMRREFEYWYPLDLRVSGKDLVQNHLTFFLYVHLAIFPREFWPKGIRVNGHLMLNGEKMSKSSGNFLTLEDAISKFGADATRVALADAGDGMDDANFDETVANSAILRLFELRKWCEELINEPHILDASAGETYTSIRHARIRNPDCIQRPHDAPKNFWDELFEDELNGLVRKTELSYQAAQYKAALKTGFYYFTNARDSYRESTKAAGVGMHAGIVKQYIQLQAIVLAPLISHWAEYIHCDVLRSTCPASIHLVSFPQVADQDARLVAIRDYVRAVASSITSAEGAQQKKLAKGKIMSFDPKKTKKLTIYMTMAYPLWQDRAIALISTTFDSLDAGTPLNVKRLAAQFSKQDSKKSMPFVNSLKQRLDAGESQAAVLERKIPFDECDTLRQMVPGLQQSLVKCLKVEIVRVVGKEGAKKGRLMHGDDGLKSIHDIEDLPGVAEMATPGAPTFFFDNV